MTRVEKLGHELADALRAEELAVGRLRSAELTLAKLEKELEELEGRENDDGWKGLAQEKLDRLLG